MILTKIRQFRHDQLFRGIPLDELYEFRLSVNEARELIAETGSCFVTALPETLSDQEVRRMVHRQQCMGITLDVCS